jgi:hypothetical protein
MPFWGDTTGVLFLSIVQEAPVPPVQLNPNIPDELQRIIEKCLEKDRLRYQHASDVRSDLKRLARNWRSSTNAVAPAVEPVVADVSLNGGVPSQDPAASQVTATALPARSHWKTWLSLLALVAAVAAGVLYWRSHNRVTLTDKDTCSARRFR